MEQFSKNLSWSNSIFEVEERNALLDLKKRLLGLMRTTYFWEEDDACND